MSLKKYCPENIKKIIHRIRIEINKKRGSPPPDNILRPLGGFGVFGHGVKSFADVGTLKNIISSFIQLIKISKLKKRTLPNYCIRSY